ncbi:hypothetical protein D3C72_1765760 [compost metagenome]
MALLETININEVTARDQETHAKTELRHEHGSERFQVHHQRRGLCPSMLHLDYFRREHRRLPTTGQIHPADDKAV